MTLSRTPTPQRGATKVVSLPLQGKHNEAPAS